MPEEAQASPHVPELNVSEREKATAALRAALAGSYDIQRELGRGGMATVYLAHDRRHDRSVALKVLDPTLGASMSVERFLREIRVTASLAHPNVLPLFDSGAAEGLLYYVMPYVEGETLRARLTREGALPIGDIVRLLRELADALAHAHERGVIHRDLKPENVLLAGGHAVIADFGIARAVRSAREAQSQEGASHGNALTEAGVSLGTPGYMSPEQAAAAPVVDMRTDLYALGVIAYETLAGAHPFDAPTPQAMIAAHISRAPSAVAGRRRDAPAALASLVMRLLAKEPFERPPDATAVLKELDALAQPHLPATSRFVIRAVATTLLFGLGIGVYVFWRQASGSRPTHIIASVAVLPFANTSGDPQDDFFSDGLTDELAHALSNRPSLRLAGRDASYAFKAKHVAAEAIGKALGVDAFISATVRRAGDRIRVNPQLVSTSDGVVLWDGVFESRSGDVFAVQDSLTRAVMAALVPALHAGGADSVKTVSGAAPVAVDASRGTRDADAYELYLKGMYYWHERGAANVGRSIGLFQQAIARDPTFARAYAALSSAYGTYAVYVPEATDSMAPLLSTSASRAMILDSTLADAQLAMAGVLVRDQRFAAAELHFRAAIRIEPANQFAHHSLGNMLVATGRTDAALAELRLAVRLDPLAKSAGTMLAEALIDARQFNKAEDEARRVLAIDSTFPLAINSLGLAQAFGGRPDSAIHTLKRGVQLYPDFVGFPERLLFASAAAGKWDDVEQMRTALRRPGLDHTGGVLPAFADFVLGNRGPLLRLLGTRAGRVRWFGMFRGNGCNPLSDPLWDDPGYRSAMRELGVGPCPQARPWPLPPRPAGRN